MKQHEETRPGRRIGEGVREVTGALRQNGVSTFTGARIQFVRWACEQFAAHPVRGVGMGGYQTTIREELGGLGDA